MAPVMAAHRIAVATGKALLLLLLAALSYALAQLVARVARLVLTRTHMREQHLLDLGGIQLPQLRSQLLLLRVGHRPSSRTWHPHSDPCPVAASATHSPAPYDAPMNVGVLVLSMKHPRSTSARLLGRAR